MTQDPLAPTDNPAPQIALYRCRHGSMLHRANDQVIGASLRDYGEWAEEELFLLSHLLEAGNWALDLGANIGSHSLAFCRFVAKTGRVISIDAQSAAFHLLVANLLINNAEQAVPMCAIAGNHCGIEFIPAEARPKTNLGGATFVNRREGLAKKSASADLLIPVLCTTIDSLHLRHCDLIKIDVEGMELEVLQGAEATLRRFSPVIYFEQTSSARFEETVSYLRRLDYVFYWHVSRPFNRNNLRGTTHNIFGTSVEVNVLAAPSKRSLPDVVLSQVTPIPAAKYEPPVPAIDISGWALPEDAYLKLPPLEREIFDREALASA